GYALPRRLQIEFSQVVQSALDESGKEMTAEDIWQIFNREYLEAPGSYRYVSHHLVEDSTQQRVELATEIEIDGRAQKIRGTGNGPIDAFIAGVSKQIGQTISVVDYHEHSMSVGADAAAATYIELKLGDGRALYGVGRDANIVTASLKAILSGVNRALAQTGEQRRVA
ncbi:MAG: 2-isopropylmalate synthase, partial [Pseudomonadota bacterium]|nr:2-isopropylmalate synthase [Pseudomonadota bacterium]